MGRRRRGEKDWAGLALQVSALLALAGLISPQIRAVILAAGSVVLGALVLILAGLIAFGLYRVFTRAGRSVGEGVASASSVDVAEASSPEAPGTTEDPAASSTPLNFQQELRSIDWFQFEKLVAWMCRKLDYTVTRRGGANPDGGIDLVIEKNGEVKAVQCKHWKSWNVGVKAVREFLGALTDAGIKKGILITICGFTSEARQLAQKHNIEILGEHELAKMLELTDAQHDCEALAILRDPRKFCPKCEREMVLRTAGKGLNAGQQFWGCSAYPRCRYTMPFV